MKKSTLIILSILISSLGFTQTVHKTNPITNVYLPKGKKSSLSLAYNALQGGVIDFNYKIREDLQVVSSISIDKRKIDDYYIFQGSYKGTQTNSVVNLGLSKSIDLPSFNNFLEIQSGLAIGNYQYHTTQVVQLDVEQPENHYDVSGLSLYSSFLHHWSRNSRDFYMGLRADVTHHNRFDVEDSWLDKTHDKQGTTLPSIGPVIGINANINRFSFGSQLGVQFRKSVAITEQISEPLMESISTIYTQGTSANFIVRVGYSLF